MSYRDWHVGMKVVCIRDDGWFCSSHPGTQPRPAFPVKDEVYEISALDFDGALFITLVGFGEEDSFHAVAFRPVQPRKTDISIFTAMLNTRHKEAPSPVVTSDHEVPA